MSDVIRLNIKGKGIKARLPDSGRDAGYSDFNEGEDSYKRELENQYQTGFNDGYATAQNEFELKYTEEIVAKTQDFYNILNSIDDRIIELEEGIIKIAIKTSARIAEKILHREIEVENNIVQTLNEALKKVVGAAEVIVKINPEDYDNISVEQNGQLVMKEFNRIKIEPDANIQKGGCYVESEIGNVDARISSQVNEIIKNIELRLLETD